MMDNSCDIFIELVHSEEVSGQPNTKEFIKKLSSREREIVVDFKGKRILSLTVPKTVFNPYQTPAAPIIIDMIMKRIIDVKGKRVVDLGCGCGIIGLATSLMECARVLYTDINPNVVSIEEHELFREMDRVVIQDLCEKESGASHEMVIYSFPSLVVSKPIDWDSYESGIYRNPDFVSRIIRDVAKVLIPLGEFVFFYRIYPKEIDQFARLIAQLSHDFDMDSLRCLLHYSEETWGGIFSIFSVLRK